MTGGIKLRTKLCSKPENMKLLIESCNITLEEISEPNPDEKIEYHVASDLESPDPNICSPQFLDSSKTLRSQNEAPCIYVIGVLGLDNYTSHFSVMVELVDKTGRNHPIILSEGIPQTAQLPMNTPKYYMVSIDDENITKLSLQLTPIHGDPDMYVSTKNRTPSIEDYELCSTNSFIFNDILDITKE